jgi:hypothetical protein
MHEMVGAAGFEPTTTSPPGLAIVSAGVRGGVEYARTGHLFDGSDRGRPPLLVPSLVPRMVRGISVADLTIRVHLIGGEVLDYPISIDRAVDTIRGNRTALEFDGWTAQALDSTDRTVVRDVLAHINGDALRIGPGKGLDRRKPEDPGWHTPQAMFYLSTPDTAVAIPARHILAIAIVDPESRAGARPGFVPREGDVAT